MIERYSTPEMRNIFSAQHQFDTYLKVELACSKSFYLHHVIPEEDYQKLVKNASFSLKRIEELEEITHHDVIAFTRAVSESLGEEKKWIHYLLTSTDVVDTSRSVMYKEANTILKKRIEDMLFTLKEKALQYQNTPCIGRTHGIHADITSFGLKFALYYDELQRNYQRFIEACSQIEVAKISGAVGNFANVPSYVQDDVAKELGLSSSFISTQVLQRDRHAYYISCLTLVTSTLEKIAYEIRLLQQTEIGEAEEYFSKGQKGSSAMPHKRNPIGSENIVGCARMMRGYMMSIYEDIPLWHERDISHSSVERVMLPDAIMLSEYMLIRMNKIVKNLVVYEEKMLKNIYLTHGVIFSQRVLSALIEKGLSREESYDKVQALTQISYYEQKDFQTHLLEDAWIHQYLNDEEISSLFSLDYYLKAVAEIYKRVGIQ